MTSRVVHFLIDKSSRCSLSNNLAENSIRPFTVGRKNWEFSNSQKGAKASATIYSIIETAKANHLNTFKYLRYLLEKMPGLDYQNQPDLLEELMPWSHEVQAICK